MNWLKDRHKVNYAEENNQNIRLINGKKVLVHSDAFVPTNRTQEEIEEEYKILKEASDQLKDWIPS